MRLRANIVGLALALPLAAGVGYAVGEVTESSPPALEDVRTTVSAHRNSPSHGLELDRKGGVAAVDEYVLGEFEKPAR